MSAQKFCVQCGAPLQQGARFCPGCGESISSAQTAPPSLDGRDDSGTTPLFSRAHTAPAAIHQVGKLFKKRWKIWAGIGAAVLIALIVVVFIAGSPINRFNASLNKGDYIAAMAIYQADISGSDKAERDAISKLEERLAVTKDSYLQEKTDYESASNTLDAIAQTGLVDLNAIRMAREEIEAMNQSRTAFATGERLLGMQDYEGAISSLRMVILSDENYNAAQRKLTEAADALRAATLAQASDLSADHAYSQAIAVLESALRALPGDVQLQEELAACRSAAQANRKESLLTAAQDLADNGDYAGAFAQLEIGITEFPGDPDLENAKRNYMDAFVTAARTRSDALLNAGDLDGACAEIAAALGVLPDNQELADRASELTQYRPVSLFDLEPYEKVKSWNYQSVKNWSLNTDKDNEGNGDYLRGLRFGVRDERDSNYGYMINGKYDIISGVFAMHYDSRAKDERHWATMKIVGDGNILFDTEIMYGTTPPANFQITITGVQDLRIEMRSSSDWLGSVRFGLLDVQLQKALP